MGSNTSNLTLYKPAVNETGWDSSVNANFDTIDKMPNIRKLTNKSGGSVAVGDVVIVDTTTTDSFTTTASAYNAGALGVVLDATIANDAAGLVIVGGYAATINVADATAIGDYLYTSTTIKQATSETNVRAGLLGVALSASGGAGTVSGIIKGIPYGFPPMDSTDPANITGTAAAGTANIAAHRDHVHVLDATIGRRVRGNLTASDTAGGLFAWANPIAGDILVTRITIYLSTKATGACTADIGVAANGSTLSDTIIDGIDLNTGTAPLIFDNIVDKGTNGKERRVVGNGQYITGSVASGASAGLVGKYVIDYISMA